MCYLKKHYPCAEFPEPNFVDESIDHVMCPGCINLGAYAIHKYKNGLWHGPTDYPVPGADESCFQWPNSVGLDPISDDYENKSSTSD
jgi:hypothetical protein